VPFSCSNFSSIAYPSLFFFPSEDEGFGSIWPKQHEFGEVLAEFDQARSWVNDISWSPSGFRLAFAGHGSSLTFVQILSDSPSLIQTINHKGLPFTQCKFLSDNTVCAVGHDQTPYIFQVLSLFSFSVFASLFYFRSLLQAEGSEAEPRWSQLCTLDKEEKAEDKKPTATTSATSNARAMFQRESFCFSLPSPLLR
jgi:hypothetical protein